MYLVEILWSQTFISRPHCFSWFIPKSWNTAKFFPRKSMETFVYFLDNCQLKKICTLATSPTLTKWFGTIRILTVGNAASVYFKIHFRRNLRSILWLKTILLSRKYRKEFLVSSRWLHYRREAKVLWSCSFVCLSVCLFVCLPVCLFVCSSVYRITQKVMIGFEWNFQGL